jgi:hypothetical protein
LFLMREVAGEATLRTEAIDRERGIILSEERTRATPPYRMVVDELSFLLREDLLAQRIPIGLTEVIANAPRERFRTLNGSFERRIELPQGSDEKGIKAKIRSGVLEITVPKNADDSAKRYRIEIRSDSAVGLSAG